MNGSVAENGSGQNGTSTRLQKADISATEALKATDQVESNAHSSKGTKRSAEEVTTTEPTESIGIANKRPRRSDQARGVSSHMDSIATLGNGRATSKKSTKGSTEDREEDSLTPTEGEIVSGYVELTPIPKKALPALSNAERKELERFLEIGKEDGWREDWIGNLAFVDKDLANPDGKSRDRSKKTLLGWALRGKLSLKLLYNLIRFVHNFDKIPPAAKNILASADPASAGSILDVLRRVYYDPKVLQEDGWTTKKSPKPLGASGGPYRIGDKVFAQGSEGVVIAYIHDHDIGDLWKAMWLEDFDTFDLEVEELDDARKRFERKMKLKEQQTSAGSSQSTKTSSTGKPDATTDMSGRRSGRYASADVHVKGIEHGIVLAVSYSRGARPGVLWPARVLHFSETKAYGSQNKRGTTKQKVDVIFLAPYWNGPPTSSGSRRVESYAESVSRQGSSVFNSGPLFELENIEVSPESIQEYPYDGERGLDMDELRTSFKFAGLPKAAFSRFVDSHRLALGLKTYSEQVMKSTAATEIDKTSAGLLEAHPLAGQTACFPQALLHLPFEFILSQLPSPESSDGQMMFGEANSEVEPALQLGVMLAAMKPPTCWGKGDSVVLHTKTSPETPINPRPFASPPVALDFGSQPADGQVPVERFLSGLNSLQEILGTKDDSMSALLMQNLNELLSKVPNTAEELKKLPADVQGDRLRALVNLWIVVKTHGEELISSYKLGGTGSCLIDWRRACERIYKFITVAFSSDGFGNGVSCVLYDSVCNLHVTSSECFERSVRLPAAIKASKLAGAGSSDNLRLISNVKEKYMVMAEKEVIRRAHSKTYLRRLKRKCTSVSVDNEVVALTGDSEGNGGEDTKGSKGSWNAAIASVAASVQAVDMIMGGECVNVFCLTRPPGHHAGRELHPMKAVSNGFCLLNNAACAALYATAPVSEGGPGLKRVCVIDIDVHHGNGTQDILCSTYDPRFLYVSIHAGGSDVNGSLAGGYAEQFSHHLAATPKVGIYPGRCGDSSPHAGVLNIPLGAKVTSHALGAALVTKVTPAVEEFSPELIIVSTGFDAHKNDPLGLGGLNAEDFGTLTEVLCKLAHKSCSGRLLSVLEGGYGVPCCRQPSTTFLPEEPRKVSAEETPSSNGTTPQANGEEPTDKGAASEEKGSVDSQPSSDKVGEESKQSQEVQNGTSVQPENPSSVASKPDLAALKQLTILDLGEELPDTMKDEMPYALMKRLDKCHAEGFMECVREHVATLAKCNSRS